jgi:NADH:ubiquinone oxidoreductase subunit 6 (subunit J)
MNSPLMMGFLALTILTCGSAFFMLWTKNVLHAALAMFLTMLGLAGFYVLAFADVMAVSHLMIYVGGVLILILFGIMMTSDRSAKSGEFNELWTEQKGRFWAFSIGLTVFLGLFWLMGQQTFYSFTDIDQHSKIGQVGLSFMLEYSFPFELTGIFLLIALVGATYIAKNHE